jgi:type VI secretion system secreted protein VgrG
VLRSRAGFIASVGVTALLCSASLAQAQSVGAAASFAVKGGSAVNINGTGTVINGDVGISTGTSITGTFVVTPPYVQHLPNDTATTNAQASILTLYTALGAGTGSPIGPELSNLVLGPGTYDIGAGLLSSPGGALSGNLTLSGAGTYIFRASSSLTANVLSTVTLIGVDPCQVFWRVPAQATINGVNFVGNVISDNGGPGVVLGVDAILTGRALRAVNYFCRSATTISAGVEPAKGWGRGLAVTG